MSKLCQKDRDFLKVVEGAGPFVAGKRCRCLVKSGHLLLVVPEDRELALKVLSLYQPQSFAARLIVRVLHLAIRFRGLRLLRDIELNIREDSPLAEIAHQGDFGFLLGNPDRDARRIICLYEGEGRSLVSKIGIGGVSKETVEREISSMSALEHGLAGVPRIVDQTVEERYASYTVQWVDGVSPKPGEEAGLFRFLRAWSCGRDFKPLVMMGFWHDLRDSVVEVEEKAFLRQVENLEVRESVLHGDFAPWNVKRSRSGDVVVLDWEFSRVDGAAGIDGAHYLFQTCILVKNMSCGKAVQFVRSWAEREGAAYLEYSGWKGKIFQWVGVYLLYTHYVLKQDRKDLIQCWKESE